jgi:hypothetical protein
VKKLIFAFFILAFVAGCSPAIEQLPASTSTQSAPIIELEKPISTPELPDVETKSPPASTPEQTMRQVVESTKNDLAKALSISADQIRVVEAKSTSWPDTSLGCPQKNVAYSAVITPGYWILLEARGKQYPYHTDQNNQIVLCVVTAENSDSKDRPLPVIPVDPTELDDGIPWVPVN